MKATALIKSILNYLNQQSFNIIEGKCSLFVYKFITSISLSNSISNNILTSKTKIGFAVNILSYIVKSRMARCFGILFEKSHIYSINTTRYLY